MKVKVVAFFVILILLVNTFFPCIRVLGKEKDSNEVIKEKYQFLSHEGKNLQTQDTFEYRDDCFTRSSFAGCKHLEILSIQAASASSSWYSPEDGNYQIDPSKNAYNIVEMLKKMKFDNVTTNKYYQTEKHENSMGVAVGHKTIIQNGKPYVLLAIIPRSANYKQEWAGNFIVGDGDIHEGFKLARDEVLRYVKQYIKENNINGDIKVWTAGWSRGAAVSNMIGGFFAGGGIEYFGQNVSITPEDVYCYTIGTPRPIKDGLDKNIELSVSGNRAEPEYSNDTLGEPFQYTKGGKVQKSDSIYGGIRSIISLNDVFTTLPLEVWGFSYYGTVIPSTKDLVSESEMLKELNSISEYINNEYADNGKVKQIKNKTFDLKTLSIIETNTETSIADFFKQRLKGIEELAKSNKQYQDEHYQNAFKSIAGIFGMSEVFLKEDSLNINIDQNETIESLAYIYLAYASEKLQKDGKAENETQAIALAVEDLLSYFSGEEIDNSTFTIDDFIRLFAKYMSDNENEPISDAVVSGIISIVPEENRWFLDSFKYFDKNYNYEHDVTVEEALKAYIKACYYGADPECYYKDEYADPLQVRNILCFTMLIALSNDLPEIQPLLLDETGQITGKASKFESAIEVILSKFKTIKDENGNVIKTYSNISEIADDKMVNLLDMLLSEIVQKSEELYGEEYKNEFQNQINTLKENITEARRMVSSIILYTDNGINSKEMIENVITFVDNAMLIPTNHYCEIYLAQARASNRYEEHFPKNETEEYKCIEGTGQVFDQTKDNKLSFRFNIEYEIFIQNGKVFVDNKLVQKDNYVATKGSTIITFTKDYTNTLSEGEHTLKVALNSGEEVVTQFSIVKAQNNTPDNKNDSNGENKTETQSILDILSNTSSNPKTGDTIVIWISLFVISIIGIIVVLIYKKK